jgi:hypothetical protein
MYPSRKVGPDTSFQDFQRPVESNYGGVVYPVYNSNNNGRQEFSPLQQQQQQQQHPRGNVYGTHVPQQQQQQQRQHFQQQQQQQQHHPIYVQHQPSYASDDERIPRQNFETSHGPKVCKSKGPLIFLTIKLTLHCFCSARLKSY